MFASSLQSGPRPFHSSAGVVACRRSLKPSLRVAPKTTCMAAPTQKVSELPASLRKIVGAFQMVPDPMARYKQLLFYATKLPAMPAEDHTPENKVQGCVSQVWVKPELRSDDLIYWQADSDSQLTKGLAALLVLGLSGCSPTEVLSVQPGFVELLGLKQSLTPSRNNGFLNMLRLMQAKALEVMKSQAQAVDGSSSSSSSAASPSSAIGTSSSGDGASSTSTSADTSPATPSTPSTSTSSRTPIEDSMRRKLTSALQPQLLVIENQSGAHAGHEGSHFQGGKAGQSGETHFRVEVVAAAFEGKGLVARHRMVNQLLAEEFALGLHALTIDTKTPAEAAKK